MCILKLKSENTKQFCILSQDDTYNELGSELSISRFGAMAISSEMEQRMENEKRRLLTELKLIPN